jgi:hypothetical protein
MSAQAQIPPNVLINEIAFLADYMDVIRHEHETVDES